MLLPVGGIVSDRLGRFPTLVGVPVLVLATSYLGMAWLDAAPSFERLLTVELWLAALYAMYAGTLVPLLTEIIPGKARSSGYSIILSLANGIFGSFTPFIATGLIEITGDRASPAFGSRPARRSASWAASRCGAIWCRPSVQAAVAE